MLSIVIRLRSFECLQDLLWQGLVKIKSMFIIPMGALQKFGVRHARPAMKPPSTEAKAKL